MKRFIFTIFLFLPILMFGNELADLNAQKFGILTLIPPVVAITLAFITKDVIFSLFIGVFSGTFMMFIAQDNIFSAFIKGFINVCNRMVHSMADPWNAGIILQVLAIGGVVALITRMGGTKAVAEWLAKKDKKHKS